MNDEEEPHDRKAEAIERRADSIREAQRDADDLEAERRAKIPTPRSDELFKSVSANLHAPIDYVNAINRLHKNARELERDLADARAKNNP